MRKLIAAATLVAATALLTACGDDKGVDTAKSPVEAGSAAILAKYIPAEFDGFHMSSGWNDDGNERQLRCFFRQAHPTYASWTDHLLGFFLDMGLKVVLPSEEDGLGIVAARTSSGWSVENIGIDPTTTTADVFEAQVKRCVDELDLKMKMASDERSEAEKNTDTWRAAASPFAGDKAQLDQSVESGREFRAQHEQLGQDDKLLQEQQHEQAK